MVGDRGSLHRKVPRPVLGGDWPLRLKIWRGEPGVGRIRLRHAVAEIRLINRVGWTISDHRAAVTPLLD